MRYLTVFVTIVFMLAIQSRGQGTNTSVRAKDLLLGGDISMLTRIEKSGGVFRDNGKADDFISILKKNGCNCFRLRLFVNPSYRNEVINDLPYTLELAQRIKNANMKLVLDLHYSDTWADPGHQLKPEAWSSLDFPSLEKIVEEYTATTITHFKESGALPDIVQIGNEITPGMLWPDGRLEGKKSDYAQWDRLTRLLKAGIRGVRRPLEKTDNVKIMLHIDRGGDISSTNWFFDKINKQNVPYDIIGLSYYPWWHGPIENLRSNLNETAKAFGKDILIAETSYPYDEKSWTLENEALRADVSAKAPRATAEARSFSAESGVARSAFIPRTESPGSSAKTDKNMNWLISPQGQQKFLTDLIKTVLNTPDNRGIGVLYWYPESIPVKGIYVWNNGATALFDAKGNSLPALKTFHPKSNQPQ